MTKLDKLLPLTFWGNYCMIGYNCNKRMTWICDKLNITGNKEYNVTLNKQRNMMQRNTLRVLYVTLQLRRCLVRTPSDWCYYDHENHCLSRLLIVEQYLRCYPIIHLVNISLRNMLLNTTEQPGTIHLLCPLPPPATTPMMRTRARMAAYPSWSV